MYNELMKWKIPPEDKVYEALAAVASGRVRFEGNKSIQAKVYSSSGHKYYTVHYDAETRSASSNDNSSFYTGQIGYPIMAVLLASGVIDYDHQVATWLADIPWKDINTKHKNNWSAAVEEVLHQVEGERGADTARIRAEVARIYTEIKALKLERITDRTKPPTGY